MKAANIVIINFYSKEIILLPSAAYQTSVQMMLKKKEKHEARFAEEIFSYTVSESRMPVWELLLMNDKWQLLN